MFPGMNPRDVKKAMKRMGIEQRDIDAVQVIIKTRSKELVIDNPQVAEVMMMGQKTYQITGEAVERSLEAEISEEDIETVAQQAEVSKKEAEQALRDSKGDLAQAIMNLKNSS